MPILKSNSIKLINMLQSPICGGSISYNNNVFLDQKNNIFPILKGLPVLINRDRSLFDLDSLGGSMIQRRGVMVNEIKNLLDQNRVVKKECISFIREVKRVAKQEGFDKAKILIVGGGGLGVGVGDLINDPDLEIISFDVYWSEFISFIADGHDVPLIDGAVHGVWAQAVLEHVLDPQRVVSELHRVTCNNGYVYVEVPFMQMVHEGPYDFTRFSHSGLRWLFRNFDELSAGSIDGPGTTLRWSLRFFVLSISRSKNIAAAIYWGCIWLSWIDRFIPESYRILSSSGFFFFGRKSICPIESHKIVAYYRGI